MQNVELSERPSTLPTPPKGRFKHRNTPAKPDPWLQRKFAVGIIVALTIWSFYVVVGRVCAPSIRQRNDAPFSRATAIGSMVGFIIVWLLWSWNYLVIIIRGPGFSKNHVPKCGPPQTNFIPPDPLAPITYSSLTSDPAGPDPSELAPVANAISGFRNPPEQFSSSTLVGDHANSKTRWKEIPRPVPQVILGPRWCTYCQINKPDRTHHCRHCGTCVTQFDHHCLWIGQCVGWANHKFFITFNLWATIFCAYIVILQGIFLSREAEVDGQVIGLTAVAGMFFLFAIMMLISHVHLILTGKTTIESYQGRDQYDAEAEVLNKEFGYIWRNLEKRKVQKRWKEEWGGLPVDARWKYGSTMQQWQQEMGANPIGWILPFGKPLGDGISFPSNPRFGPNGEWLPKKEWPKEYQ